MTGIHITIDLAVIAAAHGQEAPRQGLPRVVPKRFAGDAKSSEAWLQGYDGGEQLVGFMNDMFRMGL